MTEEVLVEHIDGMVVITINRPQAKNAINRAVSYAVCEAIDELDRRPDLRIGILTGAGGNFCSGMDLKAFLAGEKIRVDGRGILGMAFSPPKKPMIAAVEGYALAGGFECALVCDQYGLINALTEPGQALEEAKRMARRIIANAPLSVAASKRIIVEQRDWPLDTMFALQEDIANPVLKSADAREGASAFAERRAPVWKSE